MSDTKKYEGKVCTPIGCNAEHCTYNENGCDCVAEHINVTGRSAQSTGETSCATFKPKQNF